MTAGRTLSFDAERERDGGSTLGLGTTGNFSPGEGDFSFGGGGAGAGEGDFFGDLVI